MVTGTHRLCDMAIDGFIEERHETESTLAVVVSVEVVVANDQVLNVPEGLQKLTQRCFRNQWELQERKNFRRWLTGGGLKTRG